MLILVAHAADARASGTQEKGLLRKSRAIVSAHIAPMRAQPLLEFHPHLGLNRARLRAGPDATHQVQPRLRLVQIVIAFHNRFSVERQEEIARNCAQFVAEEGRRSDPHHDHWLLVEIEDAADDRGIFAIPFAP